MYPKETSLKRAIKNAQKMNDKRLSAGEKLLEKAYKLLAQGKKK